MIAHAMAERRTEAAAAGVDLVKGEPRKHKVPKVHLNKLNLARHPNQIFLRRSLPARSHTLNRTSA